MFPAVPVRQWVVSLPKRLRYFLVRDARLLNRVVRIALNEMERAIRAHSPDAPEESGSGGVVFIHRLRLLDGEPVANERAYLPHRLCPGILDNDFTDLSLYSVLATQYNMKPDHAEQEILAELATNEVAKLLELKQPAVVLVFHRETCTQENLVIEYVDSEFRADRFQFYTHLEADAQKQPYIFERYLINAS